MQNLSLQSLVPISVCLITLGVITKRAHESSVIVKRIPVRYHRRRGVEVVGRRRRDLREGVVVVDGRQVAADVVVPVVAAVVAEVTVGRAREAGAPRQGDLWDEFHQK